MDINNPNILWKDYDVSALPLNEYELSQKTSGSVTIREYYFDGYTTVDGRTRAYICMHKNTDCDPKAAILYLGDENGEFDGEFITDMLEKNYAVFSLDYMGYAENKTRFTLYPPTLEECNLHGQTEYSAPEVTKTSPWYIWPCIARRAVLLIQKLMPEKKIFAVGMGLGGCTVYKLAAFDDAITACATMLNIIPNVVGSGNPIINYRASLDNNAYSSLTKIPMFIAISSNDEDGSLDKMSELAENTESLCKMRIVERAFKRGISVAYPFIDDFFMSADTEKSYLQPKITASNSDGNLYFNIKNNEITDGKHYKINLFVSFCINEPPYRNWMNIPVIGLGEDCISHINVCDETNTISAFANFTDDDGDIQSTPLFSVVPKTLGITGKEGVKHHKIYDGSMGIDGWSTRKGGKLSIVKGPFDIDGITSERNSIATFKPGDTLFRMSSYVMLQIMACGTGTITATVYTKNAQYNAYAELNGENVWTKISFTHGNFKNLAGILADWEEIIMLELSSDDKFIISSVLWV